MAKINIEDSEYYPASNEFITLKSTLIVAEQTVYEFIENIEEISLNGIVTYKSNTELEEFEYLLTEIKGYFSLLNNYKILISERLLKFDEEDNFELGECLMKLFYCIKNETNFRALFSTDIKTSSLERISNTIIAFKTMNKGGAPKKEQKSILSSNQQAIFFLTLSHLKGIKPISNRGIASLLNNLEQGSVQVLERDLSNYKNIPLSILEKKGLVEFAKKLLESLENTI